MSLDPELTRREAGQEGVDQLDPLVLFLYVLMRDHATPGAVARVIEQAEVIAELSGEPPYRARYTNVDLARMATRYAARLRRG